MAKTVEEFDVGAAPERWFPTIANPEKWPKWTSLVRSPPTRGSRTRKVYGTGGMKVESETADCQEEAAEGFRQTSGLLQTSESGLKMRPSRMESSVIGRPEYELPSSLLGSLAARRKVQEQFDTAIERSIKNLSRILET